MIWRFTLSAVLTWLCLGCLTAGAQPYTSEPGPYTVSEERGVWTDEDREDREVPWKLYIPKEDGPFPVVIWSHGGGGSREGGAYLGRHLASHGYAAFHLQHPGTDESIIGDDGVEGMVRRLSNPFAVLSRFGDIPFALKAIEAMARRGKYETRIDASRAGMSGHSLGAITTLAVSGQDFGTLSPNFAVRDFKGAFVMSPSPPRRGLPEDAFETMIHPLFHLTGTKDGSPSGDLEPDDRRIPFDTIDDVDQYLVVLDGAVHGTFSGRSVSGDPNLARHHNLVKMAAVAFWDYRLKGSEEARAWLEEGGFAAAVGERGTYEVKLVTPADMSGP